MNTYDPTKPITLVNWPPSLKQPPKKKKPQKPTDNPNPPEIPFWERVGK